MKTDLLIELGCEELPPKALKRLGTCFKNEIETLSSDLNIVFSGIEWFAAPRRLAVLMKEVEETQPDTVEEKKGPSFSVAYDEQGNPTKAAQGWARSLGLALEDVDVLETSKGKWLYKKVTVKGKNIDSLIPAVVEKAVSRLPVPKMMRWGSNEHQFVRPVHNYCLLFGERTIPASLFGINSSNQVLGHRFHSPDAITVPHANQYQELLKEHNVIPGFADRKEIIRQQVNKLATSMDAVPSYDEDLLEEISSLVEWPVTLTAAFPKSFLEVPKEALIYTMKDDQKYIPLLNDGGDLLDSFLFVSNISSKAPEKVISGNERVIRPRLHDAQFFYSEDKKVSSDTRLDSLKSIVYQKKLGTVYDRALRIANLAKSYANLLSPEYASLAYKAGLYAKSDLSSQMVYEFPSVQGSMGKYYAKIEGMDDLVCNAIEEHYLPRYAGDALPKHTVSIATALADKIDQIVGIFSIGQVPTGDKDPFALRRCAIGILRICVEMDIDIPLQTLLSEAIKGYPEQGNHELLNDVESFISSRLSTYYTDQGYTVKQIKSIVTVGVTSLVDVDKRLVAAKSLLQSNAQAVATLAALNKRVANILKKEPSLPEFSVNPSLFVEQAETALFDAVSEVKSKQENIIGQGDYQGALVLLVGLNDLISEFFDTVMVNVKENSIRQNRLSLLKLVREVFTKVIDFAELD
ncbi:MAG: glycine--tRNA ligase subunit beta [Aestuariibacter sp.]